MEAIYHGRIEEAKLLIALVSDENLNAKDEVLSHLCGFRRQSRSARDARSR